MGLLVSALLGDVDDIKKTIEELKDNTDLLSNELNARDKKGNTPLMLAAAKGHLEIVNLLASLPQTNVNAQNVFGSTALMAAAEDNNSDIINALLDHKADVNLKNQQSYTALAVAAANGHMDAVNSLLVSKNTALNEPIGTGQSPLILATAFGHLEIVKILMNQKGIEPNFKDENGFTALTIAAQFDKKEIREFLQSRSADANLTNEVIMKISPDAYKALGGTPINQAYIIEKYKKYLQIKYKNNPEKYPDIDEFFDAFRKGQCAGLSGLWLYRKSFDDESQFFSMLREISNWDEMEESLQAGDRFLENIFEKFLNDIFWIQSKSALINLEVKQKDLKYQRKIAQRELVEALNIIKASQSSSLLAEEFSFVFNVTKKELEELLNMVVNENKLVRIQGPNHVMAVTFMDGKYYAYDPKAKNGEVAFDSLVALQEYIEISVYSSCGLNTNIMPIDLKVFDQSKREPYPYKMHGGQCVEYFLQKNRDVNRTINNTMTALTFACFKGEMVTVQTLLKDRRTDVNKQDKDGFFPLIGAAQNGYLDVINALLLRDDIKINQVSQQGTALSNAIYFENIAIVETLIKNSKIDLDVQDFSGNTASIYAANYGQLTALKMLIDAGANLNMVSFEERKTALMRAVENHHLDNIKLLVQTESVDVNLQDSEGQNALMLAIISNQDKPVAQIDAVTAILDSKKIDLSLQDNAGNTALDFALKSGNVEIIQLIKRKLELSQLIMTMESLDDQRHAETKYDEEISIMTSKDTTKKPPLLRQMENYIRSENLKESQFKNKQKLDDTEHPDDDRFDKGIDSP